MQTSCHTKVLKGGIAESNNRNAWLRLQIPTTDALNLRNKQLVAAISKLLIAPHHILGNVTITVHMHDHIYCVQIFDH